MKLLHFIATALCMTSAAAELKLNEPAPLFSAKTHEGKDFHLSSRKGKWTVLYFYPKADTPGCTKQACAFRDSIEKIRSLGAEVIGVSANSIEEQATFHKKYDLNFPLLADPDRKIIELYGAKMKIMPVANRWTLILGPNLRIRSLEKDVDPTMDAVHVAKTLKGLKSEAIPADSGRL